ncbi:TRAP transporter substrate-binding protein [Desulforhopalus singaporensis]|uniref:Tripartite ATP-independent transporter solute receptor, DctP family n=1 Tax=Desulforhopalus singaporensis TaxID=91360 RepID=A0A1H0SLY6_9BACT|nr:TRAP transporter substrate-binding protein [Desulforhopalus singaporensis]SDP42258.1 tripartite ATP-independent transporter solute receptor, DctP family [Desulforhopalus singaporensis]
MKNYAGRLSLAVLLIFGLCLNFSAAAWSATWKMALGDSNGSPQHEVGKKFKEALEAKTNGKYKVTLFLNGQLGSEQDTVNDAAMGTLDMSCLAINNVTPFSPTVGVLSLPYVIQSLEEAAMLTQGEVGRELTENTIRDAGVRIVAWTYTGFRVLTNSKKPVSTLDDLQGLIVRVPKNEIMIDTYKSWGINPSPMAWSETFTALQQKVVDGQDNPYLTINAMQFYTVQKYITPIRYLFSIEPLIISEQLYQSLTPEMQEIVLAAGREATSHSQKFLADSEAAIIKDLTENKGMEIVMPADNEKLWIEKATQAVWPKHYKSIGGKEKLEKVLEILGRPQQL